MTYYYFGSGSIETLGCAKVQKNIYVLYKWGERSVVYVKPKAVRGILEKIAVKKVFLNYKLGQYTPIYQDTLNSLYNEEELISELEARTLAQDYIDREQQRVAANIRNCGANTI